MSGDSAFVSQGRLVGHRVSLTCGNLSGHGIGQDQVGKNVVGKSSVTELLRLVPHQGQEGMYDFLKKWRRGWRENLGVPPRDCRTTW